MKKFCVVYNTTTSYDAVVQAATKAEAIAKVKEVVGEPIVIEGAREINDL